MYISVICPLGGIVVLDGLLDVGTFCGDGTFSLPIGHNIYRVYLPGLDGSDSVSVIVYGIKELSVVDFIYNIMQDDRWSSIVLSNRCSYISTWHCARFSQPSFRMEIMRHMIQTFHTYKDRDGCMDFAFRDKSYYLPEFDIPSLSRRGRFLPGYL